MYRAENTSSNGSYTVANLVAAAGFDYLTAAVAYSCIIRGRCLATGLHATGVPKKEGDSCLGPCRDMALHFDCQLESNDVYKAFCNTQLTTNYIQR
jgi:hypothetical protein